MCTCGFSGNMRMDNKGRDFWEMEIGNVMEDSKNVMAPLNKKSLGGSPGFFYIILKRLRSYCFIHQSSRFTQQNSRLYCQATLFNQLLRFFSIRTL